MNASSGSGEWPSVNVVFCIREKLNHPMPAVTRRRKKCPNAGLLLIRVEPSACQPKDKKQPHFWERNDQRKAFPPSVRKGTEPCQPMPRPTPKSTRRTRLENPTVGDCRLLNHAQSMLQANPAGACVVSFLVFSFTVCCGKPAPTGIRQPQVPHPTFTTKLATNKSLLADTMPTHKTIISLGFSKNVAATARKCCAFLISQHNLPQ